MLASIDLAADGAAGHPYRGRHLRQNFLIFPRGNAAHQRPQHMLAEPTVLAQHFIGRNFHLAFGLVPQAGPLHFDLAVRQLNAAPLRAVMADVPAGLAGSTRSGDLLGAQHQDQFQSLVADLVDHGFHHLAGAFDQVDDGKQDLSVGLTELLDDGGRLARSAGHDVIRFLHGGWLLSDSSWQPDSIETGATAAYQPSTRLGTPSDAKLHPLHAQRVGRVPLLPVGDRIASDICTEVS